MRVSNIRLFILGLLFAVLVAPIDAPLSLAQQSGPVQPPKQPQQQQPPPQQKPPEQQQKKEEQEQYALTIDVPLVNVDVIVTDRNGTPLPDLKREHFRILEDGVPQSITNFAPTDAPITIVMLVEFSKLYYGIFSAYATYMGEFFLKHLKQDDWVALVSYDLKPRIEVDFTRNKNEVQQTLARMYFPGFSEANLYDSVHYVIDRLRDTKGKKAILILASGYDTFSRKTLDDTIKLLRQTDVTIFSVGAARYIFERIESRGGFSGPWGGADRSGYYQAENNLRAFAEITGGRSWFPRFEGEWNNIFSDVATSLRNQYTLGYTPANRTADGKFRKIKVELVAPDGGPLKVIDQNGKQVKYVIYARQGYIAPKAGISD